MDEKDAKNYEIGFLIKDESDTLGIIKTIGDYKATITNEGPIKRIQLAYPIKKETSACFGYIFFSMLPENIIKLNDSLKINSKILRFLIITPPIIGTSLPSSRPIRKSSPIKPIKPTQPIKKFEPTQILSNEALERKLEEILK